MDCTVKGAYEPAPLDGFVPQAHGVLDAHRVGKRLWQGSFPGHRNLRDEGFHAVVLCAEDLQHLGTGSGDVEIVRAPFWDEDDPAVVRECLPIAQRAARRVVQLLRLGRRVLVTCRAGRNRSGLVTALVLLDTLPGETPQRIVRHIQRQRENALTNEGFVRAIRGLR